ncbi:MAG: efflux RND transporter periplasmic adaptor subunit [Chitinophagaceae bacterium]
MKQFPILFSFMIIASLLGACSHVNEDKEITEPAAPVPADEVTLTIDQYNIAGIKLGKVETRNLASIIKVNGTLDVPPQNVVSISAPMGGFIRSAGLLPGQLVKKGQVMAIVENADFIDIQQDYLESVNRMEFLELELRRQEELRREEINAAKTLQQVNSEYKMMRAKINGLEQKLLLIGINKSALNSGKIVRTSNLHSPITGYVTESNVNRGKYVNPTDILFQLTDKTHLHLALDVFEKDLATIKVGQPIKFALANEIDFTRQAKVFLIGKAKGTDGMIPVHCHIASVNDADLLPGLYVKAWIETSDNEVASLPSEAIVQSDGKDFIFIREDTSQNRTRFKMMLVGKGLENEGFTAVTLPQDFNLLQKAVVIKGAYTLLSALKNVEE